MLRNTNKNIIFAMLNFILSGATLFYGYQVMSSILGMSAVGLFALLISLTGVGRLVDLGSSHAVIKYLSKKSYNCRYQHRSMARVINVSLLFGTLLNLLICFATWLLVEIFLDELVSGEQYLLAVDILPYIILLNFLRTTAQIFIGIFRGVHYGFYGSIIEISCNIIVFSFVYYSLAYFGISGYVSLLIVGQAAVVLISIITLQIAFPKLRLPIFSFRKIYIKSLFFYSIKIQFLSYTSGIWEPLLKSILTIKFGLEALGVYEICYKAITMTRSVLVVGLTALIPETVRNLKNSYVTISEYRKHLKYFLLMNFILYSLILLIGPFAAKMIFGGEQLTFFTFLSLIGLAYLGNALSVPAYNLGVASGTVGFNVYHNISLLVCLGIYFMITNSQTNIVSFLIVISLMQVIHSLLLKIAIERNLLR